MGTVAKIKFTSCVHILWGNTVRSLNEFYKYQVYHRKMNGDEPMRSINFELLVKNMYL